jgi:magnesium transporter
MLRMTQEAATPALGQENNGVRSQRSVQNVKQTKLVGPTAFGTICDVQRVHARDIRKLDTAFSVSNEPSIELRNQAILINADPVRAIIMRNTCLVFVPDGADSLLSILRESFREATHPEQGDAPYEFKALEALLSTLCRYFETDYEKRAPVVSSALDRLAHGRIAAEELETLRVFKNTMNEFESQVDGVRRALMEILDNEEDLRLLYLTKLQDDPTLLNDLWSFDSEEAEVLIENYLQDIFSTRTKASLMQHRIQNTESLVMLKLDSMRNYLLGVDILFSIVAISLSVGTFIAGVFGMNLDSHLQEKPGWFWSVTSFSIGIMFVIGLASYLFFRRQGVFI